MSAPVSVTFRCRSAKFAGSIGLASWFGNVPSSSKYIGTRSMGRPSNTVGTVCPAMPLPASTATFSGRMLDTSTSFFRCSAYPVSRSRDTMRPAGPVPSGTPAATICRSSASPVSWPTGLAPARHSLMPL